MLPATEIPHSRKASLYFMRFGTKSGMTHTGSIWKKESLSRRVLAAVARALGIPGRLGFADVRNHLSTERLRQLMKTDTFIFHGYTELFLDDRWVKATPTFNLSLCEKFGVNPLNFDGRNDSLFHPYDREGKKHMEYVRDHGHFADVPYERIVAYFREYYPAYFQYHDNVRADDFEKEAVAEKK
jgi:transglutaminase-like putative cysteine protease